MHVIEVPDRELKLELPSSWDETSIEQACEIFKLSYMHLAGFIDRNEYLTRSLFYLTGMKRNHRIKAWESMAPEEIVLEKNAKIYQMGEDLCTWSLNDKGTQINYETVRNNLPVISVGRKKLYGPADLITDLTFGEFRAAVDEMATHFRLASDIDTIKESDEALNRFIACLYRPAKKTRSKELPKTRQTFNRSTINTSYTAPIPIWQKTMILLWFSYCIKFLKSEDLLIENRIVNLSVLFPEDEYQEVSSEPSASGAGWSSLLFSLAEKGVFGNIENVDKQGIFDILLYLYDNHLKQQKLKRK